MSIFPVKISMWMLATWNKLCWATIFSQFWDVSPLLILALDRQQTWSCWLFCYMF
jgi:hypothetical protein